MNLNLNKRERYAVMGAGALLCLFLAARLVVMPIMHKKERLERSILVRTVELAEMQRLKSEYDALRAEIEYARSQLKRKDKDFRLISFLNRLAGTVGIQDKISSMKPSTRTLPDSDARMAVVELKLQEIDLAQLTAYLHGIESTPDMMFVSRMSINTEARTGVMEAVLQVETSQL